MYPDAAQLAVLRADMAQALGDVCTVGGMRGVPRIYNAAVYTNMPCLLRVVSPNQTSSTEEMTDQPSRFELMFPYTYTLEEKDDITHSGEHYEVTEVLDDQSPLVFRAVELQRSKKP